MQHAKQAVDRKCESTAVSRPFEGQLGYRTLCAHCDHQAGSTQSFTALSLPIPADSRRCSLQPPGRRRETTALTCLEKPPEILTLHLKRFSCKGKHQVKLRTNVLFSMKFSLAQFLSSSVQNASYSSYSLYAVVNHTGNLNVGHYTALCHSAVTDAWHYFDDSAVRAVQDSLLQSSNAYMLLYSRKPFHKPKIHGL